VSRDFDLDPELEQLLREAAADPDSHLLRVPRQKVWRTLEEAERAHAVSPRQTGLTAIERELLSVHHAELGRLLLLAARKAIFAKPDSSFRWHRFSSKKSKVEDRDRAAFQRQITDRVDRGFGDERSVLGRDLLLRCASVAAAEFPSIGQLCAASLRIWPESVGRIYIAIDFIDRGLPDMALRTLRGVAREEPSSELLSFAWENIGFALSLKGDFKNAALACRNAATIGPVRHFPSMSWLCASLQAGDPRLVDESAEYLDATSSADLRLVGWFCSNQRRSRLSGVWRPTDTSRQIVARMSDRLGTCSARVAELFLR